MLSGSVIAFLFIPSFRLFLSLPLPLSCLQYLLMLTSNLLKNINEEGDVRFFSLCFYYYSLDFILFYFLSGLSQGGKIF